jgi:hypothetical protein
MDDFNERIAKLVERHEALALSIEHLAIESAKHDRQIENLTSKIEALIEENKRTAREARLFQRFVLNMGLRMDERIAKLEEGEDGQEPSAA